MPKYYMHGVFYCRHNKIIEAPNKEVAEIKFLQSLSKNLDDGYTDIEVCKEILTSDDDDVTVEKGD